MSNQKTYRVFIASASTAPSAGQKRAQEETPEQFAFGIYFERDPAQRISARHSLPHNPTSPPCTALGCYDPKLDTHVWRYARKSKTATSATQAELEAMIFVLTEHNNQHTPANEDAKITFYLSSGTIDKCFRYFTAGNTNLAEAVRQFKQEANASLWYALEHQIGFSHYKYQVCLSQSAHRSTAFEASLIPGRGVATQLAHTAAGKPTPHAVTKRKINLAVAQRRLERAREALCCAELGARQAQAIAGSD